VLVNPETPLLQLAAQRCPKNHNSQKNNTIGPTTRAKTKMALTLEQLETHQPTRTKGEPQTLYIL
jgi:hypothetical protein